MFFNQSLTVTRVSGGSYVGGVWQPGGEVTPAPVIHASVQPTNDSDLALLPEGRRQQETYTLYTSLDEPLYVANDHTQTNSDKVEIYGKQFEILHAEKWANQIIPHHKSIAVLLAEQP